MVKARPDIMPKRLSLSQSGLFWLWVAGVVLFLDRVTKSLALHHLSLNDSLAVLPHLNLTLAFNRGAAFSFLGAASGWQVNLLTAIALAVAIFIIVILARLSSKRRLLCIALAFVLGGALGNVWDRVQYMSVIDFIDFYIGYYHWPVFNLADSAICLGAFGILLEGFLTDQVSKKKHGIE